MSVPETASHTSWYLTALNGWMDGWMGGWVDRWVDGWMDGWMGGWVDGEILTFLRIIWHYT